MINKSFWGQKKVLITGNTGFKGSWLTLTLELLGADVLGFALPPITNPSLYELCKIDNTIKTIYDDIRNIEALSNTITAYKPDIIFHMAAQPLVRFSYKEPVETYQVNVMGTVNILESLRRVNQLESRTRVLINITTDKCYENKEWFWGYRENEPLGGYDPYSSSKACSELVTSSYRNSFFNVEDYNNHKTAISTVRAGNVIGGGDFSADRLIPDCIESLINDKVISIRNPHAIRPWQHVLEPIHGYLLLAQKMYENGVDFSQAWNFGPEDGDARPVEWIVKNLCNKWGGSNTYEMDEEDHPHEASYLKLDCSKAKALLGWQPKWSIDDALDAIVSWSLAYKSKNNIRDITIGQVKSYFNL